MESSPYPAPPQRIGSLGGTLAAAPPLTAEQPLQRRGSPVAFLVGEGSQVVHSAASTATPGPIVDDTATRRMNRPLAEAGLLRTSSSATAARFSVSWGTSKETRPMGTWTLPYRSLRYSTRPALNSPTALPTSGVTVPDLGFGIRPRGPRMRPELADVGHHRRGGDGQVEVERAAGGELLGQLLATDQVGAGLLGLLGLVAVGEDGDANRLSGAMGQRHRPAHQLVRLAGVDPELERGLDRLVELGWASALTSSTASPGGCRVSLS